MAKAMVFTSWQAPQSLCSTPLQPSHRRQQQQGCSALTKSPSVGQVYMAANNITVKGSR
jgi:hypothetical protein